MNQNIPAIISVVSFLLATLFPTAHAQVVTGNDYVRIEVRVQTGQDRKSEKGKREDTVTQQKTLNITLSGKARTPETRKGTWQAYGRDVKAAPQDPKTLYSALSVAAASHDGGVYRSQDAGQTWSRFDKVQVHGTIMSIGLHNSDPKQVYIGARYEGEIYGTQDGGDTWQSMPLPGPVKDIYSIACA